MILLRDFQEQESKWQWRQIKRDKLINKYLKTLKYTRRRLYKWFGISQQDYYVYLGQLITDAMNDLAWCKLNILLDEKIAYS